MPSSDACTTQNCATAFRDSLMPKSGSYRATRHTVKLAEQEALLIRESIKWVARSFEPARAVREMLRLTSELPGLNRGRSHPARFDSG
jgi:hypothetical protein